jgi:gluconolactonase
MKSGSHPLSTLLNTSQIYQPNLSQSIVNPNGGYHFNDLVYLTSIGNDTRPGGIYSVDPSNGLNYDVEIVINSYFGSLLNGPNDVTWASLPSPNDSTQRKLVMFFRSRISVLWLRIIRSRHHCLMLSVRFDPSEKLLTPVITRADTLIPNGVPVNANPTLLYVTDCSPSIEGGVLSQGGGFNSSGSPAISRYHLTPNGIPINKRLTSFARRGIADGIHIDDQGRIWKGENEGIVVRSGDEKVLWIFNAEYFIKGDEQGGAPIKIANFASAGGALVVLAIERLWTVKLNEVLISNDR